MQELTIFGIDIDYFRFAASCLAVLLLIWVIGEPSHYDNDMEEVDE